jgi:hypothetical protein
MNRIDTKMPFGIDRDLAIVAISAFIWGLGEGLFIFFLPLALPSNHERKPLGASHPKLNGNRGTDYLLQ